MRPFLLVLCLALTLGCGESIEPVTPAESDFIRFVEDGPDRGRLETAIVSYENPRGVHVDLIAVVHLGDPSYYRSLQTFFKAYDAVLFELVMSEGADLGKRKEEGEESIVSRVQRNMCRALELEFQLDALDYTPSNFVHADLTATEFAKAWREKGESLFSLLMRLVIAQLKSLESGMGGHLTGPAMLEALRSPDRALRLKLLLAKEFSYIESFLASFETGKEGEESVLLGERNKAAIRVLEEEMDRGGKTLALFYGAGHMPDLEMRLQRDLGFRKTGQAWFTAWDIHP